jgi:hypothetical protein
MEDTKNTKERIKENNAKHADARDKMQGGQRLPLLVDTTSRGGNVSQWEMCHKLWCFREKASWN